MKRTPRSIRRVRLALRLSAPVLRTGWRAAVFTARVRLICSHGVRPIVGRRRLRERAQPEPEGGPGLPRRVGTAVVPAAAGAAAMYFLDPTSGSHRRRLARERSRLLIRRPGYATNANAGYMPEISPAEPGAWGAATFGTQQSAP